MKKKYIIQLLTYLVIFGLLDWKKNYFDKSMKENVEANSMIITQAIISIGMTILTGISDIIELLEKKL